MRERRRIKVEGVVQGVGFRPFVYGLARRHGLFGHVLNDPAGVTIEIEGERASVEAFERAVWNEPPPLAVIDRVSGEQIPVDGDTAFVIEPSVGDAQKQVFISPDVCICDDCLRELFDPADRRYRYPFINCAHCGPRFTIICDVPYDRARTALAAFSMCTDCRREYDDPLDRRFHAQPNACAVCGPQLMLAESGEGLVPKAIGDAALRAAQRLFSEGAIVAIKGLGGYHLACDAMNRQAVARLRACKHREEKPFALMVPDLATAEALCLINNDERAVLTSRRRPIALLRQRLPSPAAPEVAPGHRYLGVMLPYTPLHYLLVSGTRGQEQQFLAPAPWPLTPVLVMTSGNRRDEPIAYRDEDAFARLSGIADAFLTHNRKIHVRCDDSVVRSWESGMGCSVGLSRTPHTQNPTPPLSFIRRSRGYAPEPIQLPFDCPQPILAVGAHFKNTFCLCKGRHAFVSHHIGELENLETLNSFREGINHFRHLFDIDPEVVAHDLHPDYLSTSYALESEVATRMGVQHHHAHIASVIAEHGLEGPVLGVVFDGTGYGTDGSIWGGEFFVADLVDFERGGHLAYCPLPGGQAAIRRPWRIAAAHLYQLYGDDFLDLDIPLVRRLSRPQWSVLRQMIECGVNSPLTSSLGRLFDAVAALIGLRDEVSYEGQAAIELEMLADEACREAYRFEAEGRWPHVINVRPVIAAVVEDLRGSVPPATISARFHNAVARLVADICVRIREKTCVGRAALSGGVFQNTFLLHRTLDQLRAHAFDVYVNTRVPCNDGGVSFGQAAVAACRLRASG